MSPRRSWRARTEPSATGLTISRCEGLKASTTCTLPPGVRRSAEKPLWYLTSPEPASCLRLALEFGEQVGRRLAQHVDQHVEPSAMGHGDDRLLDAAATAFLHQIIEQRDQRLAPFERKALLADEARVQVALESLGRGQVAAGCCAAPPALKRCCMRPSWNSSCSHRRSSVSETCANSAPIVPQYTCSSRARISRSVARFGDPCVAAAGVELGVQVRVAQAHVGRDRARADAARCIRPKRIDLGDQVTAIARGLHQARDRALLFAGAPPAAIAPCEVPVPPASVAPESASASKNARHRRATAAGVAQIVGVQTLYIGGVAARQRLRRSAGSESIGSISKVCRNLRCSYGAKNAVYSRA